MIDSYYVKTKRMANVAIIYKLRCISDIVFAVVSIVVVFEM